MSVVFIQIRPVHSKFDIELYGEQKMMLLLLKFPY